jgi:hypothetical protein
MSLVDCLAAWVKLADKPVDFPDRARRYALKRRTDIVRLDCVVILRVPPQAGEVTAHQFADFPFHLSFRLLHPVVSRSKILMFESPFVVTLARDRVREWLR